MLLDISAMYNTKSNYLVSDWLPTNNYTNYKDDLDDIKLNSWFSKNDESLLPSVNFSHPQHRTQNNNLDLGVDLDSFEKVKTWYFELRKYIPKEAPIIIAGNKCDLPTRAVNLDDAQAYARQNGFEHVGTSAKSGENVNETFELIARKIIDKKNSA